MKAGVFSFVQLIKTLLYNLVSADYVAHAIAAKKI